MVRGKFIAPINFEFNLHRVTRGGERRIRGKLYEDFCPPSFRGANRRPNSLASLRSFDANGPVSPFLVAEEEWNSDGKGRQSNDIGESVLSLFPPPLPERNNKKTFVQRGTRSRILLIPSYFDLPFSIYSL